MACANITLKSNEYTIRQKLLTTNYSPVIYNNYTKLSSGYIQLCFNYNTSFLNCKKWKLDPNEYHINSSRFLIYDAANSAYALGHYKLNSDNSTNICIPTELLPVYHLESIFISAWLLSIITLLIALYFNVPCKRVSKSKYDFRPMYCHMISFLIAYIFLILFQLTYYESWGQSWLIFVEYGAAYIDLTTFSWLSVVGFDTFNAFRLKKLKTDLTCSPKQFFFRSLYAWGLPFVSVILAIVCEQLPYPNMKRHFGMSVQGVEATAISNVVLFGTQSITLLVQFLFCILTAVNIRRGMKRFHDDHAVHNTFQKRKFLKIFIKLVIVMSITSILATIGYGIYFLTRSPLAYVLIMGYALQGVYLFLIHGLEPLKKKIVNIFLRRIVVS